MASLPPGGHGHGGRGGGRLLRLVWLLRPLDVRALRSCHHPITHTLGDGLGIGNPQRAPRQAASPSPTGRIAFHSDPGGSDDLYLMDGDGSNLVQLTRGMETSVPPVWSPDGTHVAFVCCLPRRDAIAVVGADGRGLMTVATGSGEVGRPSWSPDGRSIVFASFEDQRVQVVNADGTGLRELIAAGVDPSWSPDGSRLVYLSAADGDLEVLVANADGTGGGQLTANDGPDYSPAWSPDGSHIAFVSERDGNPEIYVMAADGSGQRNLSASAVPDDAPVWSPDGMRVAYVSYLDGADPYTIGSGNAEVFVVSVDGSGRTNLTSDPAWQGDPAWSPDGSRIVFTRRQGHGELYVMDADGSHVEHLAGVAGQANDCCAAWQPTP